MSRFTVKITGLETIAAISDFTARAVAGSLPNLMAAKSAALTYIQGQWVENAFNTLKRPTRGYTDSIKVDETTLGGVVYSDSPYAGVLEYGHSGFDLKKILQTSTKTRWFWTKDGKTRKVVRGLIIPFRHALPGKGGAPSATMQTMPANIAKQARKLSVSSVTDTFTAPGISKAQAESLGPYFGIRPEGAGGQDVMRRSYQWGGSLKDVGGIYEGMVRMSQGGGYVTFRKMLENQTGKWIVPPMPGKYIARNTAQQVGPAVSRMLQDALRSDIGG